MWNEPMKERLDRIPRLYETEDVSIKDKLIWLHFFLAGCDWYVAEISDDTCFGFVILNNDIEMAEWGHFSFSELKSLKINGWLEVDCELDEFWKVRPVSEFNKICIAQGWVKEKTDG